MQCIFTTVKRGGEVLEQGHMLWVSGTDAYWWARKVFGSVELQLEICEQDGETPHSHHAQVEVTYDTRY